MNELSQCLMGSLIVQTLGQPIKQKMYSLQTQPGVISAMLHRMGISDANQSRSSKFAAGIALNLSPRDCHLDWTKRTTNARVPIDRLKDTQRR